VAKAAYLETFWVNDFNRPGSMQYCGYVESWRSKNDINNNCVGIAITASSDSQFRGRYYEITLPFGINFCNQYINAFGIVAQRYNSRKMKLSPCSFRDGFFRIRVDH
jgi:hypothetical protein